METEITQAAPEQANTLPAAPEARAALALNASETEKTLRELASKYASITEVKDKAGREQAHNATMTLVRARTSIKKVADEAREDAKRFNAAVIAEERRLTAIVEPEEKRLKGLRDDWDAAEAARKEAEAAAERARLLAISEKIAALRNYLTLASQCRSSERIQALFDKLAAEEITAEVYAEFEDEAAQAKAETLARIKPVLEAKLAEEAERAEEQRRLEAQRMAAAEAQRAAEEAKRQADEAAALILAQRNELERQQRELAEQQAELQRQQMAVAAAAQEKAVVAEEPPAELAAWPDADGVIEVAQTAEPVLHIVGPEAAPEPIPGIDDVADVTSEASLTSATTPTSMDRPTDDQLIEVLAQHYRVHESKVIAWLLDMDMDTAAERMSAEFF